MLTHDYELLMLKKELGLSIGTAPTFYTVRLYSNSVTISADLVDTDFTEVSGDGYAALPVDLVDASDGSPYFVVTAGSGEDKAKKTVSSTTLTWTLTAASKAIKGYYITASCNLKGTGVDDYVLCAAEGVFVTLASGDKYRITLDVRM